MSYPSMLAAGLTAEGTFLPTDLFAGEADIVTDRGVVGATAIVQLSIVARDEAGLIVPWNPLTGAATIAGTFSGVGTAADTITINGVVFTLVASSANAHQITIGGTPTITATNAAAILNAAATQDETGVSASSSGAVLTLTALSSGAGSNFVISESGTGFSFAGGATALAGGSAETESRAIGIAAQAAAISGNCPFFTGGVFNHAVLVWPATVTTLAQRKAAFDRTNIQIDKLLGVSTTMTIP